MIAIHDHPLGATFHVRLQPLAARTAITGMTGEALKLSLSAPLLDGKANVAVVDFFAEVFSVPRGTVQVVTGERSHDKVIRIVGRTAAELQQMLREHFSV